MKVILYMAMTVNGFIAKENDETPWSDTVWKKYYEFAKECGNIIVGSRTHKLMADSDEFSKIGNPEVVVLSHQQHKGAVSVRVPQEAIDIIKDKGFEKIFVGGGSNVNTQFMKDGLIDELIIQIEPQIFGKGIPLFREENFDFDLELLNVEKLTPNLLQLHYKVNK